MIVCSLLRVEVCLRYNMNNAMKDSSGIESILSIRNGPINVDDNPDCLSFNLPDYHAFSCFLYVLVAVILLLVNINTPLVLTIWQTAHWSEHQSTFNIDSRFSFDEINSRTLVVVLLGVSAVQNAIMSISMLNRAARTMMFSKRHVNYVFAMFDVILSGWFKYLVASWTSLLTLNSQLLIVGIAVARELTRVSNEGSMYIVVQARHTLRLPTSRFWADVVGLCTFWFVVFMNLHSTTAPKAPGFLITWAVMIFVVDFIRTAWSGWFCSGLLKNPHSYRAGDVLIVLAYRMFISAAVFLMPYW